MRFHQECRCVVPLVAARKSDVSATEASLSLSEPPSPLPPPLGSSVRHREKKMSLFSLRRRRLVRRSGENEEEEDDHDEGGGEEEEGGRHKKCKLMRRT